MAAWRRSTPPQRRKEGDPRMLYWSLLFLAIALVAALLGFGGIAAAAAGIARLLFVLFLILFLVSLIAHLVRRAR